MKKVIAFIAAVLVIGGIYFFSHLGGAVKLAIETVGTQTLGTKVTVGAVDISLAGKKGSIDGLSIANPPGFKNPDILKTKSISVALGDISSKVVVLKNITVDGLTVAYEIGPKGTNFSTLQNNIKSSTSSSKSANGSNSGGKSNVKVVIQKLKIVNASVIPAIAGHGKPIPLPEIVMTNIGSKSDPATTAKVAQEIMSRVLAASSTVVMKSGLSSIPVNGTLQKATGALKGLFSK